MQINKIKGNKENITTDITEIKRIIRKYYGQLCANKLESLKEIDELLETYNLMIK